MSAEDFAPKEEDLAPKTAPGFYNQSASIYFKPRSDGCH